MTADANANIGIRHEWEQLRLALKWLPYAVSDISSQSGLYEPGDIACCAGSIEQAFYDSLRELGIPLQRWEQMRKFLIPARYCIVNRHIEGPLYEVFLLTTFGRSKNTQQLGLIARYFGMPMGGTQWIKDIPGIKTFPASFGWKEKSFVFAIPIIVPSLKPGFRKQVRLVTGELERLQRFVRKKRETILHDHPVVRQSLWNRHQYKHRGHLSYDDVQDEFMPLQHTDDEITMQDDEFEDAPLTLPEPHPSKKKLRPSLLYVPPRHDITWPMRYVARDTFNVSKYLNHKPLVRLRRSLPSPYYAPCLRISSKAIGRIIW